MVPRAGSWSPTRCRSSVLFPLPLPPMMMKMSRSFTVKSRSRITTDSPYAMVRTLTVIFGRASSVPPPRWSDAEDIGDGRDDRGRDHDADDAGDHRGGGGLPDGGGAAPAADAAQASGERHQHAEDGAHEEAEEQVVEPDGVLRLEEVLRRTEVEHRARHDHPAEDPRQIGVEAEQGHHQAEREQAGKDEEVHGRNSQRPQGVDLPVCLHGAELRREGSAGAAGDDDAGHDGRDVPEHPDAHQVRDVDLRPEPPELDGADERQDESDQKIDERDDGERPRAAILDGEQEVGPPEPGLSREEAEQRKARLADEAERLATRDPAGDRGIARAREDGLRLRDAAF